MLWRAEYISHEFGVPLNLAVVEYDLLMYPDALRHAKSYVVHPKAEPGKVEKLKKEMIPDLEAKTAHLSVEGQAGVAVFVDGEKVGVAPIADQVHVGPGEHTVSCGTVTKTVVVKAGDTATVIVVIREAPASTSATAPVAPPPSASTAPSPVPSASASNIPPENPPPKDGGGAGKWIGPAALGAVGVGGIVVGVVFAGSSNGAQDDQVAIQKAANGHACSDVNSDPCKRFHSKGSDVSSANTIAYVGYIAGGVGLAGALVWSGYNLMSKGKPDDGKEPAKTSLLPWVGPQGVGACLRFSF